LLYDFRTLLPKDFSLIKFLSIFCHPNQMSSATALWQFAILEPWSKKGIKPAAGRGWKRTVRDYPWTKTDLPTTICSLTLIWVLAESLLMT